VIELWNQRAKVYEARIWYFNHDDTDLELRHILLIAHALINRDEHIEFDHGTSEQLTVLESRPTLFLSCTNGKRRQIAPKLSRHVLVEE